MQSDSEESQLIRQRHLEAIKAAYAEFPPLQPATRVRTIVTLPNPVPELASTVPDSQQPLPLNINTNADLESQLNSLPSAVALSKVISVAQKMASQDSDGATQVLSPSHIESILNSRSRSALQQQDAVQDRDEEDEEGETQFTLHEGDEGHIDLVSSLVSPREAAHDNDSDPVDFSPTQSQRALSQFPESQRFKTPATVGRKRRHNGDTVDSPALPRNPLLRGGVEDDAFSLGLSQAFAATQANTSPLVADTHVELPSDRPSPNIQLQPRPMTARSSSQMRYIMSPYPRASTEPAARYVSSKESQDERKRQALLRQQEMMNDQDDSDDAFDDEPDSIVKDRRRRQIDQRRQATVKRLSSPPIGSGRGIALSKSSPIRSPSHGSPRSARATQRTDIRCESSPTRRPSCPNPDNDSEEETEQEDNADIAVSRSSQGQGVFEDDNKENYSERGSQIPETTARLHRVTNDLPAEAQDSPSLRRGQAVNASKGAALPYSSGPFAIADSQPVQPLREREETSPVPNPDEVEEGIDCVPQSPSVVLQHTEIPSKNGAVEASESDEIDEETAKAAADGAPPQLSPCQQARSTIPETSSNEQAQNGKSLAKSDEQQQGSDSRGQYETAQTRPPPSSANSGQGNGVDLSSPPIATTPPGRRRKRMAEIAAAPSPLKSQLSFSATDALKLDQNFQSPLRKTPRLDRTILEDPRPGRSHSDLPGSSGVAQSIYGPEHDEPAVHEVDGNVPEPRTPVSAVDAGGTPAHSESPLATNSRPGKKASTNPITAPETQSQAPRSTARRETWDLEASPPQTIVPVIKTSGLKRKAKDSPNADNKTKHALTKRLKSSRTKSFSRVAPEVMDSKPEQDGAHIIPEPTVSDNGQNPGTSKHIAPLTAESMIAPNMVFACFSGKTRAYYPALCLGPANAENTRYLIQWEGYDPDEVDEYGIRSLDLRIGDQVKVDMEGFPKVSYVIRGFKDNIGKDTGATGKANANPVTDRQGHKTLLVTPRQRKSLPTKVSTDSVKAVPVSSIYLDNNMWGQMRDRVYQYRAVDPVSSSGISTPLERPSTPSTPASRKRRNLTAVVPSAPSFCLPAVPPCDGMFANMAFAISYEDPLRKATLVELIETHGGIVLQESFLDLLEPDSTELKLKPQFDDLSFTALLTERHSRKEKYMQALALGLPCLSGKWVEACIRSDRFVDWTTYLLPAGESAELDGATKSRLLPAATATASTQETQDPERNGRVRVTVKDMMSSRPNILGNSRVIVVTGKGKAEARRKPYLFLIRALGAGKIELEPDLASAKARLEMSLSNSNSRLRSLPKEDADGDTHVTEDDDGVNNGDETTEWVFVDDRDAAAAKTMFSTSVSMSTSLSASASASMSMSASPASIRATNKEKDKDKSRRKSKSRFRKSNDHDQPATNHNDTGTKDAKTTTTTVELKVKVMCNEDLVQSLILGKLWMGGQMCSPFRAGVGAGAGLL
ncbi:hypothetical protein A1O1_01855 [Capronia coronata CBS 617.96]|uniref:BRCT domain-containing protein n=1 Tax=Capronia coronata CBS 617.96 TaxID=1182541 RepID=W9YLP5_9EURO|nr:uncharacterized protein A1O1_01855 [Capronia coronata CBS 617.96]EXJ93463.1 hypothetical protein A1O1_01855 [Capronia coronata CBS 617.96]